MHNKPAHQQCPARQSFLQKLGLVVILIFIKFTLSLRYRVTVEGLDKVIEQVSRSDKPCLFLPNHPALIDPVILYSIIGMRFHPRPLADEAQAARPGLKTIFRKIIQVIIIPDVSKEGRNAKQGVQEALDSVVEALGCNQNVMLYPSGHTYRQSNEQISGNSGLDQVLSALRREGKPLPNLIIVRSSNLWGSRFSRAWGIYPRIGKILRQGIKALFANFIFFMPRRKVTVEFGIFDEFTAMAASQESGQRKEMNAWLENYYNQVSAPAKAIPLYFWQGSKPVLLEELKNKPSLAAASDLKVSEAVWKQVKDHLTEVSGRSGITQDTYLATDLDMDSLAVAELSVWIETEFGHNVDELDNLVTVKDILAATQGKLAGKMDEQRRIPKNWLKLEGRGENIRLGLPRCPNLEGADFPSLPSLFLAQARKTPSRPIIMDYMSGVKTYRGLLTGIEALQKVFQKLPGERLGIMLPCSPAVVSTYFATLLSSKVPVMVNWTLGVGNIKHCLNLASTETIVTARALTSRLIRQGFNIDAITTIKNKPVKWIFLEDLVANLSKADKLSALLRSIFSRRLDKRASRLKTAENPDGIPETAAILFTSGSETLPKGVPLTHANIVANLADVAEILHLSAADRILGMLPPFHSLGLLGNVALPMAYSLPMACHSNPAESAPLVSLINECKLTILATPPSFMDGILARAKGGDMLKSIRLAFVGAEKCPPHVFEEFKRQCPGASLCEGYGVTECSPGVSVNRPENIHPGTIGEPLPSMETAVVKNFDAEQPGGLLRAAAGETGMLIVRGPNVFSGYLAPPPELNTPAPSSPFVEFEGKRWYETGDLVSQDSNGIITFKGRLKRFIKLGGEMISLPQIENILLGHFAPYFEMDEMDGPLLAVEAKEEENPEIVLVTTRNITREEANNALREAGLSGLHSIRRVEKIESIPVLGTGKTDYRTLKNILQ